MDQNTEFYLAILFPFMDSIWNSSEWFFPCFVRKRIYNCKIKFRFLSFVVDFSSRQILVQNNSGNTRTMCEVCWKLTIKTTEQRQLGRFKIVLTAENRQIFRSFLYFHSCSVKSCSKIFLQNSLGKAHVWASFNHVTTLEPATLLKRDSRADRTRGQPIGQLWKTTSSKQDDCRKIWAENLRKFGDLFYYLNDTAFEKIWLCLPATSRWEAHKTVLTFITFFTSQPKPTFTFSFIITTEGAGTYWITITWFTRICSACTEVVVFAGIIFTVQTTTTSGVIGLDP